MDEVLSAALRYAELGWSVIPCEIGSKEPLRVGKHRLAWKRYQNHRPSGATVRKWFSADVNVAIIGGPVVIRDFDAPGSYERWATNHPVLAATLPTVRTARGHHVYCRMLGDVGVVKLDDGELRGHGGYTLAPPSVHPSGVIYQWIIEPGGELFVVDFADLDLPNAIEPVEPTKPVEAIRAKGCHNGDPISFAISATIPTRTGQRERMLFELARRVLGIVGPDLQAKELIPIFDEWWTNAESIVATKDYSLGLAAFIRAYANAKNAFGESVTRSLQIAMESPPPSWLPPRADAKTFALAALCRQLQRERGSEPFWVGCPSTGELLGVPGTTVWRWLDLFERLDAIKVVERGKRGGRKATRYRYVADDL